MASMAQRKRQLVAAEITEAALQLCAVKGFDTTTVDEIVEAAGISRRTFFRYFSSKEDVAIQLLASLGTDMRDELRARPAGEPPATALRHAVGIAIDHCVDEPLKSLRVVQLILRTPVLHARMLERQAQWREGLTIELAVRLGRDPATDMFPEMAARMALAAFEAAMLHWSVSDGAADPHVLTDRAFAMIGPALDQAG
ncbi:TetR family transcriptional regulator [Actinoplanes sp. NEAU-A12]|uniref:TetR family transcriptional regulator n=1 Tax=Actinoplanes sandaracinus TaxID=3045177 RepID=A0ABT6WWP9_9ACTN|nr:TetR family transcriptional regulator [Actinoplanes sandaracinus]MDI6104177.1 TetR family transcriptional regulator [Actinoplanes sandaracinus]